jgi:GrpB-like predicted nucleotidyltransferase (UPF0157 family)
MRFELTDSRTLAQRLADAGVTPGADARTAWLQLREVEGRRATVIDLYQMVAAPRGLSAEQLPLAERIELGHSVMPAVWPGFTLVPGSERSDPIEYVDYDPAWPARYATWRDRIAPALGDAAIRIDHVGSTAVPGLPAKPTVDIQVSVRGLEDESYVALLAAIGLQLRSRDTLHRYFRPFAGAPRDVHVHVCPAGSAWEREHLLFRDFLRTSPEARSAYAEAKSQAAARWADDRIAYTDAKSAVILAVLDAAAVWAEATGWSPVAGACPDPRR